MQIVNLSDVVETAESINVYNDGSVMTYSKEEKPFDLLIEGWKSLLLNSHEMPAFGVSLNKETVSALKNGIWVEFEFDGQKTYNEMPFEKLLIEVERSWQGFNVIRYNSDGGYDGRCFYIDLVGNNMSDFYDIIVNL